MIAIRSQSFSATSSTWVEKSTALPRSQRSRKNPFIVKAASGSRPTNGSSKISSFGSRIKALISASFCFIPWL